MRKIFVVLLFASFILNGQDLKDNQLIIFGLGEYEVTANKARLNFTIETFGGSLEEATQKGNTIISNIVDSLFKIGLNKEDFQTNSYWSGDSREPAFWSNSEDFATQMSVYISTMKLHLLDDAILLLSKFKIKKISSITFFDNNTKEHKLIASKNALANASEKATIFCENLKIGLGKVVSVNELVSSKEGDFVVIPPLRSSGMQISASQAVSIRKQVTFFGKKIKYRAGVQIIYSIKQ